MERAAPQSSAFTNNDRILYELKLGKQAPGSKAAAKALERFINEVRSP